MKKAVLFSVWQQHDVQELCRVMFDALELTWKNTDQEKLINQLYQGKMKDYVKCLEVSLKFPKFSDIKNVLKILVAGILNLIQQC